MAYVLLLALALGEFGSPHNDPVELARHFVEAGEVSGENPFLLAAVAIYESRLDNDEVSKKNACCMMQVLGGRYGNPSCSAMQNDLSLCVHIGARELSEWRAYRGAETDENTLCHYNCGCVCSSNSRKMYVSGVLWWRDFLYAVATHTPKSRITCTIRIQEKEGVLEATDSAYIWNEAIAGHDRPKIRNYEEHVKKDLKLRLKYRTCNLKHVGAWNGKRYLHERSPAFACLTSSRTYACEEEVYYASHDQAVQVAQETLEWRREALQRIWAGTFLTFLGLTTQG